MPCLAHDLLEAGAAVGGCILSLNGGGIATEELPNILGIRCEVHVTICKPFGLACNISQKFGCWAGCIWSFSLT